MTTIPPPVRHIVNGLTQIVEGDTGEVQTPAQIFGTDLKGWWNSVDSPITQDGGGNVSLIEALGNLKINFRQTTGSRQPNLISGELNGHPVLRFNGTSDGMFAGTAGDVNFLHDGSGATIITIFKVADANPDNLQTIHSSQTAGTDTGINIRYDDRSSVVRNNRLQYLIGNGAATIGNLLTADDAVVPQTFEVVEWNYETKGGDDLEVYVDGTQDTTAETTGAPVATDSTNALNIGRRPNNTSFLDGDWAETLIINRVITASERTQLASYFNSKWGL